MMSRKKSRLAAGSVASLVCVTAAATLALNNPANADSAASQTAPATSVDENIDLQPVPAGARVLISETEGSGDSEVMEFVPGAEYFTVLITCLDDSSATPARLGLVDENDPQFDMPVRCDSSRQAVTLNDGGRDVERLALEAAPGVDWKASVYVGLPENVTVE